MVQVVWLPITWAQTMVMASAWVGFTLPGMIEEPGSFSGRRSSPRPQRGPEPSRRISLAIFITETATELSAHEATTMASCSETASHLFSVVRKGGWVSLADQAGKAA